MGLSLGELFKKTKQAAKEQKKQEAFAKKMQKQQGSLTKSALKQAREFEKGLPTAKEQFSRLAAEQGRRAIDPALKDVRSAASSRGLLYSGLRKGAEEGAVSQIGMDVAEAQRAGAEDLEAQKNAIRDRALGLQSGANQAKLGLLQGNMQAQAINDQARMEALRNIGQGVGYIGGSIAGSKQQPQK